MNLHVVDEESCDPQLLESAPQADWDPDQLGEYARAQHEAIANSERSLAVSYWRLGLALYLSRRHYLSGEWGEFLDRLGIDKTRASKARAIYRTFKTEEALEGLSVQEAYACRKRKSRKSSAKKRRKSQERDSLAEWLSEVREEADSYLDEASCVKPDRAPSMLQFIDAAIEELTNLRNRVQQRRGRS